MAFPSEMSERVLAAMGLPFSVETLQLIADRLALVTAADAEWTIARAVKVLDDLEAAGASLSAQADQGGLIKAGELEWEPGGGRLSGLRSEKRALLLELMGLLNLEDLLPDQQSEDFCMTGSVRVYHG